MVELVRLAIGRRDTRQRSPGDHHPGDFAGTVEMTSTCGVRLFSVLS
jgi:hypothetical protein